MHFTTEKIKSIIQVLEQAVTEHRGTISIQDYDFFIAKEQNFSNKTFDLRDELREILFEIDSLTDLFNRQAFFRVLSYEYERASRTGQPCCICMVDLDHFKTINDTYGHLVGDRVLHVVAHHLTDKLRPYDSMCRYGGEEFLICLPNTKLDKAKKIVNRLRSGLSSLPIDLENDEQLNITASFGIVKMATNITIEDNITRADEALYAAKYGGRNQAITYEEIRLDLKKARRNVK